MGRRGRKCILGAMGWGVGGGWRCGSGGKRRRHLAFGITLLQLLQPCHCVHRLGAAKRISLTSMTQTISLDSHHGPSATSQEPNLNASIDIKCYASLCKCTSLQLGTKTVQMSRFIHDSYVCLQSKAAQRLTRVKTAGICLSTSCLHHSRHTEHFTAQRCFGPQGPPLQTSHLLPG